MANAWLLPPLPIIAASASGTAAGRDPLYVGNDYAGIVWRSDGAAAPFLVIDLGADLPIDTIALFGLSGFNFAHQVTIAIATAAQGSGFSASTPFGAAQAVLAGSVMPVSGKGVGLYSVTSPITGRYVRLLFAGLPGAVEIARAAVCERIQPERNFGFGGTFGVRDLGSLDFSRRGVLLRTRGKKLRTAGLTFSNINKDEVEALTKPLVEQIGNTETLGLFIDPASDPQRQNRGYFGPLVGDLGHTQRNARGWEAKVNVVSIF